VIKKVTDREKLVMAIIENVQRSDLNCVEEALAYFQLMEDFKLTQDEVAKKVGKERSTVANFLRILKLPRSIIELIQNDKLTFGHAKVLASISEDKDLIITLGKEAADKGQSVRELEKLIKNNKTKKENNKESEFSPETDDLRKQIENKTGLHLDLKCRSNGSGSVILKFGSKEEFNVIYDYLMRS